MRDLKTKIQNAAAIDKAARVLYRRENKFLERDGICFDEGSDYQHAQTQWAFEALEKHQKFIEWLEAGFGGMFGHQTVTPQQDAWDSIPEYIDGLKKEIAALVPKGENR